jgi:VWA domain-containing protein
VAESTEPVPKSNWDRIGLPVLIGVSVALIVAGITAAVRYLIGPPEPVHVNVALILDTSKEMRQEFGKTTRFNAAIAELVEYVEPRETDNLALWTAGGSCGPESAEEVVPFAQHNSGQIRAALRELEPQGEANLGDAIVMATGAFGDLERFPAEVEKHVFVLTAGKDTCDDDYVGNVERRLREVGEDINVNLHLFALRVSARLKQRLRGLEHELPNQVETNFPDTPTDLETDILVTAAEIEPTPTPTPSPTTPVPGPSPS